jgi:hypothetical protein
MVALGRPQGPPLQRDFLTASLAWALLVRPFGAHFGMSSAGTPGDQQKMWDMLSPRRDANDYRSFLMALFARSQAQCGRDTPA